MVIVDPIINAAGESCGAVHRLNDITDRKRAEESLRQASSYNRSLIEASPAPLVIIGPEDTITDVNSATEAVTGRSRRELIGTDFSEYFTQPELARAVYQRVFEERSVRDYPLEIRHPDGRLTPVLYNASVYRDESGQVIGVFVVARDVTRLRQTEESLRLSEQRLRLHMQQTALGVIECSTDCRVVGWNPAAEHIFGYTATEALGQHGSFLIPAGARGQTDSIWNRLLSNQRGGERSTNENVTKSGQTILCEWHNTPLAQAQQALAAGRPFPLAIVDPDLPDLDGEDLIRGLREHQRRRAAAIVLVSGEHHQGQGKRRRLATRVQSLTKPVSQEELLQAIVRGLELVAAPGPRQAARGNSLRTPRPLRILLAEDTAAGRLFATDVLTERGHVVQTVEDGREAVELVRDQGFDLILMDVQMPALDGFQATAAIRSLPDPAKSRVPIVAITAHAVQGYEARCLAAGMNGYLSKPLRSQTLIETVERLAVQPGSDPPASLGSRSNPAPEPGLQTVPPSRSTLPT